MVSGMLVLYVAMKYDYGRPDQGYSFEHYNFYHSLLHMGHDILYFDFMTIMQEHGREWMNQRLLEVVRKEKPELMFTILFRDELDPAVVREISENSDTITLNWFCDDHWRFENYSRYWAPCFNWVITTAQSALPKYAHLGYNNIIKSQWACNHFLYRKLNLPLKFDVTFVGQPHGNRRFFIQSLQDAGINVSMWGRGWESGRISQEEMIDVFNQSCINLNLSNASTSSIASKAQSMGKGRSWLSRVVKGIPFASQLLLEFLTNSNTNNIHYPEQIKARNFEVPGCGGFLFTGVAEDLENYYEIGKEIICFEDVNDLVEKALYYLQNEDERLTIAQEGYQRTLSEHTYSHRFTDIFQRLGLPHAPIFSILNGDVCKGQTKMVH